MSYDIYGQPLAGGHCEVHPQVAEPYPCFACLREHQAVRPEEAHELALLIAAHHRLDPNTRNDRCTCGERSPLGELFSRHIADEIIAAGWRR